MSRSSSSNNASTSRSKQQSSTQTAAKQTKQKKGNVEQMKYEIAGEFGVQLGADSTARENGQVGGEITKRLVKMAKNMKNEE